MADKTSIEWTRSADGSPGATWNPITGCSVVSPGCTNCYAMKLAGTRLAQHPSRAGLTRDTKAGPVWTGEVRFNELWLDQPLRWKRPRMIFVCAHGDLFHENVPDAWIDQVFAVMALAQHHTFQVLTKRANRMRAYLTAARNSGGNPWDRWTEIAMGIGYSVPGYRGSGGAVARPLPNVWLGVSAEDQQRADERIPHLLATPAAVRWVSAEPLLGPLYMATNGRFDDGDGAWNWLTGVRFDVDVDANGATGGGHKGARIDWLVAGGESGPGARPWSIQWARSLRDQCKAAGVPFFWKQHGEWSPAGMHPSETPGRFAFGDYEHDPSRMIEVDHFPRQFTMFGARSVMKAVGKSRAGRLLDGVEHNGMPGHA